MVIPLPVTVEPDLPPDTDTFNAGQQVRMISAPFPGMLGKIVSVLPGSTTLPSGVNAPAAEVQLENGEKSALPLANLEVLE
jgi:transcription antitermination factor NusG